MTLIAPRPAATLPSVFRRAGKTPATRAIRMIPDEDGARLALGSDPGLPSPAWSGTSIEDLARIALG